MTRWRRKWHKPSTGLRCEDCGQHRPYTVIRFWVTGMRYRVCGDCIEAYRHVILTNHPDD